MDARTAALELLAAADPATAQQVYNLLSKHHPPNGTPPASLQIEPPAQGGGGVWADPSEAAHAFRADPRAAEGGDHGERAPEAQPSPELPRLIAPPRLDGHTRARWAFAPGDLARPIGSAALGTARQIAEIRKPLTAEQDAEQRRKGPVVVRLPSGEWAEISVSGVRRQVVTWHVVDTIYMRANVETGELVLQWKARALWSCGDQRRVLERWIRTASAMFGADVDRIEDAYDAGWSMTGVEICSDWTGLRWHRDDSIGFVGKHRHVQYETTSGHETLGIGSRRSNISLCVYDKTLQIVSAKDGRNLPTYRQVWIAHGWDESEKVSRVEFRFALRGLMFKAEGGEILNLRDPAQLTRRNVCRAWAHASRQVRLVIPETATRLERCKIDPRWECVIAAAKIEGDLSWTQYRMISDDAWREKVRRACKFAAKNLRIVAGLAGFELESWEGLTTLARFADSVAEQESDLLECARSYAKMVDAVVGDECQAERDRWEAQGPAFVRGLKPRKIWAVGVPP